MSDDPQTIHDYLQLSTLPGRTPYDVSKSKRLALAALDRLAARPAATDAAREAQHISEALDYWEQTSNPYAQIAVAHRQYARAALKRLAALQATEKPA